MTPPLLLLLLIKKRWKILCGFLAGSAALVMVSILAVRFDGLRSYLDLLFKLPDWIDLYGVSPQKAYCIREEVFALLPRALPRFVNGFVTVFDQALLAILLILWEGKWNRKEADFDPKFALLVIVSILIAPHGNLHDLSLLVLPGFLNAHNASGEGPKQFGARLLLGSLFVVFFPVLVMAPFLLESDRLNLAVC
jgi:hypothetical protein